MPNRPLRRGPRRIRGWGLGGPSIERSFRKKTRNLKRSFRKFCRNFPRNSRRVFWCLPGRSKSRTPKFHQRFHIKYLKFQIKFHQKTSQRSSAGMATLTDHDMKTSSGALQGESLRWLSSAGGRSPHLLYTSCCRGRTAAQKQNPGAFLGHQNQQ